MSTLQRPRAHFKGVYTANVPTANNDKVSMTIDEAHVEPLGPGSMTDAQYREWAMQTKNVANPGGTSTTAWLNSYFNYFGDSAMSFAAVDAAGRATSTTMTTSTLPDGTVVTPGKDVFLTGQVQLLGDLFFDKPGSAKMVDLDPIGIYATQIFSGQFQVVVATASGPLMMLTSTDPTTAYLYDLYFDRSIAPGPPGPQMGAGIWQMALPLGSLVFDDGGHQSPTLAALETAAKAGLGLLVRYVTYYTTEGMTEAALAAAFQHANYSQAIVNPATGLIIGSIGAWSNDDPMASGPAGRLFYGTYPLTRPSAATGFAPSWRGKVPASAVVSGTAPPPPYFLGPIAAWVDTANQNVVLDFCSTIPEDTGVSAPPAPTDLQKMNYGPLTLSVESGGQEQIVNTIQYAQYDRAAYESGGGIIEVPYPAGLAAALADPKGTLTLKAGRQSLSVEISWAAVATDDRCLYLQVNDTVTYRVRPLWQGRPMPNQSLSLTISQYAFTAQNPASPTSQLVIKTLVELTAGQYVVSLPASQAYTTDAEGYITFTVTGLVPGAVMIRYRAPGDVFDPSQGNSGNNPLTAFHYFGFVSYNAFRVLPLNDFDSVPDSAVTWDFVYQHVIRYYYLLYPGMFARLALQDEATARQSATIIKTLIDAATWNSTTYMPVSRDLSDGKRKLLQRWCALNE
jgi:hypothetical protein